MRSQRSYLARRQRYLPLVILVAAIGCGHKQEELEGRTSLSGSISFNGKPIPAGTIGFESVEGYEKTSVSIKDGKYSTPRAPLGSCLVRVETYAVQFVSPASYVPIPERYSDFKDSGLTVEIKPGVNENVNFDLKP